jgi:sugar phosphate isomerase/epimerase
MRTSLCSITFRDLSRRDVVSAAHDAGLDAIEWGGDIHCPPGDRDAAADARQLCDDAGLAVSAYGSYVRLASGDPEPADVVATCAALGTDIVRVWAGPMQKDDPRRGVEPPPYEEHRDLWHDVADRCATLSKIAADAGVVVVFEHHPNTLTANAAGASRLAELTHDRGVEPAFYWQPNQFLPDDEARLADLLAMPQLPLNLHVFHWHFDGTKVDRLPLADGVVAWQQYLAKAGSPRFATLEFVRGGKVEQLREDAATLRQLLAAT